MRKLLLTLAVALSIAACTPEEVAQYEATYGDVFTAEQEAALTAPYAHWNPDVEIHHADALAAGWTEAEWPKLSCIVQRESNGLTGVHNRRDPSGGSRGLTQINGTWNRTLREAGVIRYTEDLFNPLYNFVAARWIFERSGWGPWGRSRKCG